MTQVSIAKNAARNGFPIAEVKNAIEKHPGFRYGAKNLVDFTYVSDGDVLQVGEYNLTCIATPGHTPGLMCLYEPQHRFFLSGDLILSSITPNISLFSDNDNPLKQYLQSLDKVSKLDIELTLPSHRQIIGNCLPRIAELKKHHQDRLNEIIKILENGREQNAYQVASQMTWDMTYKSFEDFPVPQKWFAIGEAIAHLKYLADKGTIQQFTKEDIIFNRLS
ncbi:MAG: MBL fold metallo-hydrolase [Peptococcia bacterium]